MMASLHQQRKAKTKPSKFNLTVTYLSGKHNTHLMIKLTLSPGHENEHHILLCIQFYKHLF